MSLLPMLVVYVGCSFIQPTVPEYTEVGIASYYGHEFHGRRTASGEIYDETKLTAAHLTLPFGTRLRVTDLATRKSVLVRVTDRGPFILGRVLDLSYQAALELGVVSRGLPWVGIEIIEADSAALPQAR